MLGKHFLNLASSYLIGWLCLLGVGVHSLFYQVYSFRCWSNSGFLPKWAIFVLVHCKSVADLSCYARPAKSQYACRLPEHFGREIGDAQLERKHSDFIYSNRRPIVVCVCACVYVRYQTTSPSVHNVLPVLKEGLRKCSNPLKSNPFSDIAPRPTDITHSKTHTH